MSSVITISPVSRIEGHAKITIHLNAKGEVEDARFHVNEFRGFEKFCEGRLLWEMPGLTSRICGICPASHLVTSGPYRFSRNPVYLGYALVMLGAGLVTGSLWLVAGTVVTVAVTHAWIVRSEEKHLLARFGFEFECYCRRTRPWI